MDELAAMRVFARVAQMGSFSKVGRLMNTSTSSVARLVNSLEDELGVRLLNRTTRQVVLTEAGQRFYEDASRILQSVDDAKRGAAAYQKGVKGIIRVHASSSASAALVVPALPQFLSMHPEVVVDMTMSEERVDIVAERIDVAIWRGNLEDSGLVARVLGSPQRVLCASPQYVKRHGLPAMPADLKRHNCIVYSARHYSAEWLFDKNGETTKVPVTGNFRTENGWILLSSALSGLGLTVLPEWMARDSIERGLLQSALNDYTVRASEVVGSVYHLVYPHRSPPPKVAAFIEFVTGLFGSGKDLRQP